ncbi:ADP-ribosyltransferase [Dickeya zeae]|uniref:ADP-ribosyltransferase n=1 Tax=Dickeya zeae TaxID=204042 RepID=UPI001C628063|nr:ADP-ribosyltransferase [Dickeya zeae]
MYPDDSFFRHLGALSNGPILQSTYKTYKNSQNNNSFILNGALRSGFNVNAYNLQINNMNDIFRAKNNLPMDLYRMTSSSEFTPNGAEVVLGIPFRYPAFLSTTRNPMVLKSFVPAIGTPTILKIKCPGGTGMALMEANNNLPNEEEILLQSYTEYQIRKANIITCPSVISVYIGNHNVNKHSFIYEIEMDIVRNSFHLASVSQTSFFFF